MKRYRIVVLLSLCLLSGTGWSFVNAADKLDKATPSITGTKMERTIGFRFYMFSKTISAWETFYGSKQLRKTYEPEIVRLGKALHIDLNPPPSKVRTKIEAAHACSAYLKSSTKQTDKIHSDYVVICDTLGATNGNVIDRLFDFIFASGPTDRVPSDLKTTVMDDLGFICESAGALGVPKKMLDELKPISEDVSKANEAKALLIPGNMFVDWESELRLFIKKESDRK